MVMVPHGSSVFSTDPARTDNAVIKALARAHRWKRIIESAGYGSVAELAAREKINQSYLCRILRLTLLAPEIAEAILEGRRDAPDLHKLVHSFPALWHDQVVCLLQRMSPMRH
jgi:hypothetical protein